MKLTDIYLHLRSDIVKIENELESHIDAEHPDLKRASSHLLKAGGKRIRPVFVLLSAQFGNYDLDQIKQVAIPLELIHMASLVHDDVIDDAELRRGKRTIKSKWDNRVAMYTGDYIFAKAIEIASRSNKQGVHDVLSKAMVDMCIGEIEQIRDQFNLDQSLRTYLRRIKRKTALLISVSCDLGARVANVADKERVALKWYGYYVGMAFQITDDILDFVGTEKQLGKPAGSDLIQGNITLPAIYAMEQDNWIKHHVTSYMQDPTGESPIKEVVNRIKHSDAIDAANKLSNDYITKALDCLEPLEDIRAKQALYDIAIYIRDRNY
ncbi:heptaprenyl diphosphate synthase component II [Paenalkalicoccus suaedae]|uniref:Heptaprenyl diphosphate synthase component 2 n=1 Tax=Paenalkalicoccus suaedae TaxID=2592382 RepID=A0A859FEF2_9BACI|nr:heptaprenyl diphosphate synthase component II [Paenalkalicoccus suaedae]QKS71092.1 heptaprenyl diphosphate synthase component II [Paenalkalicoccus suaedae]